MTLVTRLVSKKIGKKLPQHSRTATARLYLCSMKNHKKVLAAQEKAIATREKA